MCFKCGWNIHFNGLSFPKFHSCPKSPRPDESGKLHEAQGTANKRKQRPKEARLRLILALPLRECTCSCRRCGMECAVGKAQKKNDKRKNTIVAHLNGELDMFTLLYSSFFVPYLVWKSRDNGSNSIRDAMCHELERLCRKYAYFEDYFHHTLSQNR